MSMEEADSELFSKFQELNVSHISKHSEHSDGKSNTSLLSDSQKP
jgi:hypothetical protein